MSIPSGRQRLIIGRFAEYLLASGALVVQTCRDIHELNIEIREFKKTTTATATGTSLNKRFN